MITTGSRYFRGLLRGGRACPRSGSNSLRTPPWYQIPSNAGIIFGLVLKNTEAAALGLFPDRAVPKFDEPHNKSEKQLHKNPRRTLPQTRYTHYRLLKDQEGLRTQRDLRRVHEGCAEGRYDRLPEGSQRRESKSIGIRRKYGHLAK